jgi:GxxExxY protein
MKTFTNREEKNTEFTEQARNSRNISNEIHDLSHDVIGACIEVQQALGSGLLESTYVNALALELQIIGIKFVREYPINAQYKGHPLGIAYRADFLIEGQLILEAKAVQELTDEHRAQLLTYLRLSDLRFGLLVNFHAMPLAKTGVRRVLNGY